MSGEVLHSDLAAERACIGVVLMSPNAVNRLLDRGLRDHHFYRSDHASIWKAITSLSERNHGIDQITVRAELDRMGVKLNGGETSVVLDGLHGAVPAAGNALQYVDRVISMADWRSRQRALAGLVEAANRADPEGWGRGMADLEAGAHEKRTESLSPEAWAALLYDYISSETENEGIPLPFARLTDAMGGGLKPGEVMVIAGWTNHGKSIYADQILDLAASKGFRCHCYMTEMTAVTRGLRYLSRHTGVPFMTLRRRTFKEAQVKSVLDELESMSYGVTVAADWDIDDVVRDALRARYDLVVVDLIHGFHYEDERGLDRLSKAMQRLARVSTTLDGHAGTAVIGVAHLNESQMSGRTTAARPKPGLQSLKGGSSLKQDADFVSFVWQQDDDQGIPSGEGAIWIPKARSGENEGVEVFLDQRKFQFVQQASPADAARFAA